ncbi:MAG: 3-deoxy-manno-octulosonate cytidylyltransferase [Muribaculum sp.]|nr:3-deoxy-manno-octulosonate cytidylyltransferase [Muribaculum sp.]
MNIIAIIPARYNSSRFPGKPLAILGGEPVIIRVCRRVEQAGIHPVVATDDQRIYDAVIQAGFMPVMTSPVHRSGTDRICEALDKITAEGMQPDVVVNVQGDEPFIRPQQLIALCQTFTDPEVELATLVKPFPDDMPYKALENPNLVKVARKLNGDALYFSRSVIPTIRGVEKNKWPDSHVFLTHMGVYAYRPDTLRHVASLPQSPLEKAESLEQLRWLEAGLNIRTVETTGESIGIDTPEDLKRAEAFLLKISDTEIADI